jgi:hypothetical protein
VMFLESHELAVTMKATTIAAIGKKERWQQQRTMCSSGAAAVQATSTSKLKLRAGV